jgi:hypothetical protein
MNTCCYNAKQRAKSGIHWYRTLKHLHTISGSELERPGSTSEIARSNWDSLCKTTYWNFWKERNRRIFQSKKMPLADLKNLIRDEAALWRDNG